MNLRNSDAISCGLAAAALFGCGFADRPAEGDACSAIILSLNVSTDGYTCAKLTDGSVGAGNEIVRFELYSVLADGERSEIYSAPPYINTGIALYAGADEAPFFTAMSDLGMAWFEPPFIAHPEGAGPMLVAREPIAGTAAMVFDYVFIPVGSVWRKIRTQSDATSDGFDRALVAAVPAGLFIRKGLYVDYETLSGETPLYRDGDINASATGGRLLFTLQINEARDALVVADTRFEP